MSWTCSPWGMRWPSPWGVCRAARNLLLTLAAVLCGAAVSFAGLVGFVGLLVPHAARFLVGGEHKYLLAASLFLGAALVTVCDLRPGCCRPL